MSNRLKKAFLVLTAALVLPAVAGAQTSRVQGLNVQGDYIKDYTGIYTYMSEVGNVGNIIYGELGNSTGGTPADRGVGAVLGNLWDGRYGTWAIHIREITPSLGQGSYFSPANPAPGGLGFDPNTNQFESFDIQWGRKFGSTSFGARLNRSYGQLEGDLFAIGGGALTEVEYDFAAFSPTLSRNVFGIGAGLGFEMGPNSNLQVAGLWQSRTYSESDSTGLTNEDDGATTYQFAARWMWQWQPNVLVVPVAKLYNYDLSTANTLDGEPAFKNTMSGWQIGVAGNWTLGSDDLFVLGATMASNKIETESDILGSGIDNGTVTETLMPQIFAALETHVNSWLTLRFGANKGAWHTLEFEDNDVPFSYKIKDSPFSMSLGAGVKIGTLQLDGVLNNEIAHNGLYFVSGADSSPLASKVTATYSF